jgi:hypothetical protein
MRNRTRVIAAAAAVTATLAAGSTAAAMASTTGAKPGTPAKTVSASEKPGGSRAVGERQGLGAFTAVVARELHVSTARVNAALQPLFAAGQADPSSSAFAAAARSLGVSAQQLNTALMHAKQSLAGGVNAGQRPGGPKDVRSKAAGERQGLGAFTAVVARELHVSTARVNAALQPLFAAGRADPSSSAFAAAARSLGVSAQQLNTALIHAKQSLAGGS